MNNYIEYFTNYVNKNYDMNNNLISLKYYHSLRVAKLMTLLARKLNMSEDDILLAFKIGLCHDLGRFYEVVRIGQFNNLAFDHGTYSNKILYNDLFIKYMDIKEHLLFRKAIYNHNKKDIIGDLTNREKVFVQMIRDMDKIDIVALNSERRSYTFSNDPNKNVLNNYLNNNSIDIKDIDSKTDSTILYLSFFKDLYFDASFDLANKGGYLNKFLNVVKVDEDKEKLFNELTDKINKERGKIYVR